MAFDPKKQTASRWNMWGALLIMLGSGLSVFSSSLIHSPLSMIPATQILFLKSFIGALLCLPFFIKNKQHIASSPNKKWHALKAVFATIGNICYIYALQNLLLAQVTTLSLTSSFLTVFGGYIFFKEPIRLSSMLAMLCGILGVIITLQPSFAHVCLWALLPIVSAGCFALSSLLVKKISIEDKLIVSLFYLLWGMSFCALPIALWQWHALTLQQWLYLLCVSFCYVVIQWSLIEAYTYATAAFLAPFKFIRFPFGLLIGIFYFQETLSWHIIVGGCLILCGCLVIQYARHDVSFNMRQFKKV